MNEFVRPLYDVLSAYRDKIRERENINPYMDYSNIPASYLQRPSYIIQAQRFLDSLYNNPKNLDVRIIPKNIGQ